MGWEFGKLEMTDVSSNNQAFRAVVVTDLDGTLLDHQSYSYAPAQPALDWLAEQNIPLILASSKTAAEISSLQKKLNIEHPAIVENGGGVWIPSGYFAANFHPTSPGTSYDEIEKTLMSCPDELRGKFQGFCDWSTEEVAEKTGLPIEDAARARDRAWSIPGLWSGSEDEYGVFLKYLLDNGLQVTQGGRFIHIMGRTCKGTMLTWLMSCFKEEYVGSHVISIALGDAPNDKEMLEAADHAIVIPNMSGRSLTLDPLQMKGILYNAEEPGPVGWNNTILPLLQKLKP